jgi:hypothetical protein
MYIVIAKETAPAVQEAVAESVAKNPVLFFPEEQAALSDPGEAL